MKCFAALMATGLVSVSLVETQHAQPDSLWQPQIIQAHNNIVRSLAFASGGEIFVSGGDATGRNSPVEDDGTIKVWNVATATATRSMSGFRGMSLALSSDGQSIAFGTDANNDIVLWDVPSGNTRLLHGHTDWLRAVAFAPGNQTLASAANDMKVMLWNPATGQLKRTLSFALKKFPPEDSLFHEHDTMFSVAFSPDGKTVAASTEVATGTIEVLGVAGDSFDEAQFTDRVYLWDVATATSFDDSLLGTSDGLFIGW